MRGRDWVRPVALTWLFLTVLAGALLLRSTLSPPPGTTFVGTFYYVDDFYNYLSYVQQAEDGVLVFRNKLVPPSEPPALVNLEWLAVGLLSSLLGGSPLLAYRLFGFAVLFAFVALVDRWLVRAGLPPSRRLAGLLLVFTGGGLGGLMIVLDRVPGNRAYDVTAGLFPFVEILANPHFVVGTTLLLAALGAFAADQPWRGAALGTVLGLVRPYDAALLAGVAGLGVLCLTPPREWMRRLLPVAALVPVLAYDAWVFLWSPGFRAFSSSRFATAAPSLLQLTLALGPATLVAVTVARRGDRADARSRRHRLYLALWAALAIAIAVLRPVPFSLQFLAGVGAPLLALGAIGLGRWRRGALEGTVPLLAGTAAVVTWLLWNPSPYRHVPSDRFAVAAALRPVCARGDLVLAPPDIGLYVGGLTACWPFVSHSASPEHEARDRATRSFYAGTPAARARFLEETCVDHVVVPRAWGNGGLPAEAPYQPRPEIPGPGGGLAVYSRNATTPCARASPRLGVTRQ